jgi:hypothetical protein
VLPPRGWLAALLASSGTKLHALPMAGVASLARSLLMLGVRPAAAWSDALLRQVQARWQQAGPESLSLLLLALQALEVGRPAAAGPTRLPPGAAAAMGCHCIQRSACAATRAWPAALLHCRTAPRP